MEKSHAFQSCSTGSSKVCNEKNTQRRRKHWALAVVSRRQKFCPAADPLPGGVGRPKFNQLEMVTTFTYKPSLMRIDARNFELNCGNRPTNTTKHAITMHCATASLARSVINRLTNQIWHSEPRWGGTYCTRSTFRMQTSQLIWLLCLLIEACTARICAWQH